MFVTFFPVTFFPTQICDFFSVTFFPVTFFPTFYFVTRILQFLSYFNPKFKDNPASVAIQSGLCQTWSETPINPLTNDMLFVNLNKICLN